MRRLITGRGLRLLLAAGICLGTLASVGAAGGADGALPQLAEALKTEERVVEPAEAAARTRRAAELLARRGVNKQQRDALSVRMGQDEFLFSMLERGELTRVYLTYLALPNGRAGLLDRYSIWAVANPELTAEEAVLQVNMNRDRDFYACVQEVEAPSGLAVLVNKHYALPAEYVPELEALGKGYGTGSLRPEAAEAFRTMADAAKKDGISLRSVSAYRSYNTQKNTYNRYLKQYKQATVDTFSARPGHSEHQTGLALDINVASTRAHFENTPAFAWLKEHCAEYGFILRYDKGKEDVTGYRFEPWHYRYVGAEAAAAIMEQGVSYEEYLALLPVWSE